MAAGLAVGLACQFAAARQAPPVTPRPKPTAPPAAPSPLVAADQPDPYEDRPIREVRLQRPKEGGKPGEMEPLPEGVAQLARNQLRTLEGRPYKRQTIANDITNLNRVGHFKTIFSQIQLQQDGSVVVVFTFSEQPVVQDVQVVGNRELTDQELLAVADKLTGNPVDRFQIDRAARGMEEQYKNKGFYSARVEVVEKDLKDSSVVVYRVIEGERVKVMGVVFEGNRAFTPKELRSSIKTTEYVPIFESAPLDNEVRAEDEAALGRFYKDRGYLDVRIASHVQPSPNGREAIVTFRVDEGPLYTLRSVRVVYKTAEALSDYRAKHPEAKPTSTLTPAQMAELGRRSLSSAQIAGLMSIKPGDVYSEDKTRKSRESIRAAYGKLGYVVERLLGAQGVDVAIEIIRDETRPGVELLLIIDEGKPYMVGAIRIAGNDKTKQQVVMQMVRVEPERPLDIPRLAESRTILDDSRLFEPGSVKISIQAPRPESPDVRDVLIELKETNTGSFSVGVAGSSDLGLLGQVKLSQRNFDITDTPESVGSIFNAFHGGGQTASLELQPGITNQFYSVSLSEPHFLETDYSTSGRAYYNRQDLGVYNEQRYGTNVGLGRRFGTVWDGATAIRNEWIGLSDIDPTSPQDLFDIPDFSRITGVSLGLTRTSTDSAMRPSRGSQTALSIEHVGALGGDFSFTKLKANRTEYFTLYESFLGYKTLLKLENTAGWIVQGQNSAPIFERFTRGGQNFRGYNTRGVGPEGIRHDTGYPGGDNVGGAWDFFLSAEINQPLYEDIVSGVLFIDSGTVQTSPGFDRYRASVGFGLRIYIRQVSPAPLAFDFGFPFLKQDEDRERVFTFTVDIPFQ